MSHFYGQEFNYTYQGLQPVLRAFVGHMVMSAVTNNLLHTHKNYLGEVKASTNCLKDILLSTLPTLQKIPLIPLDWNRSQSEAENADMKE